MHSSYFSVMIMADQIKRAHRRSLKPKNVIKVVTKITITKNNIDECRHTISPLITKIMWEAGPLDAQVLRNFPNIQNLTCMACDLTTLKGLEGCPQLLELNCFRNSLVTLEGIDNCPLLQQLSCTSNKLIALTGIEGCQQLRKIDCSCNSLISLDELASCTLLHEVICTYNKIQSIRGIRNCSQLEILYCWNNCITSLAGIEMCGQLRRLHCSENRLASITELKGCPLMKNLNCSSNRITVLTGIEKCLQLTNLECAHNRLKSLAGVDRCLQLKELVCRSNMLTSLEPIVYLRYLWLLIHSDNPLDIQSIQVHRCLERTESNGRNGSVYADKQNVHNVHIQKCVCESIQNLLRDPKPIFAIDAIIESDLPEQAIRLLLEYCDDKTVHSHHLLTFIELLAYVWARIDRSEHKTELIKILGEQITDAMCMCLTGRFNRIVSVLVGFYPDIVIEISDSSRIGAIISVAGTKLESQEGDMLRMPYDAVKHRALAHKLLLEAGYTCEDIQPWLDAIED